ncbi:MAG: NfeD family protein [Lachnospiraceae bacterium]
MNAVYWLGLLIVLIVIEALTMGLATIWFAVGALVAFLASLLQAPIWLQIVLFLVISLVLLIFTRPIALKLLGNKKEATNVDGLIGKNAIVTDKIDNLRETGTVFINGLEWTARSQTEDTVIEKDAVVEILQVDGVKLIVRGKK